MRTGSTPDREKFRVILEGKPVELFVRTTGIPSPEHDIMTLLKNGSISPVHAQVCLPIFNLSHPAEMNHLSLHKENYGAEVGLVRDRKLFSRPGRIPDNWSGHRLNAADGEKPNKGKRDEKLAWHRTERA